MSQMLTALTLCLSILPGVGGYGSSQDSMLKDTTDSKYQVGQVWGYKTRPHERKSTFTVVRIESHPKFGSIIHVALRGLRLRRPGGELLGFTTMEHLAFTEEAIDRSAVKLLKKKGDLPDYKYGYAAWRRLFDAGEAGVFTITVAEVVDEMERGMNR